MRHPRAPRVANSSGALGPAASPGRLISTSLPPPFGATDPCPLRRLTLRPSTCVPGHQAGRTAYRRRVREELRFLTTVQFWTRGLAAPLLLFIAANIWLYRSGAD